VFSIFFLKGDAVNTRVIKASPIEYPALTVLPEGFPVVTERESQKIVRPILLFLWGRYLRRGAYVPNTVNAVADDLGVWWSYLRAAKVNWDDVSAFDVDAFREGLSKSINPRSHEPYAEQTVIRRVRTVLTFYRYALRRGWIEEDLEHPSKDGVYLASKDGRTTNSNGDDLSSEDSLLPRRTERSDEKVSAFSPSQYRAIAAHLGPTPSESNPQNACVRDRLWGELCLHTGMRPGEPEAISYYSILDLSPTDPRNPTGVTYLRIKGKGGNSRKVRLPNKILEWLIWYIENERKDAIRVGKLNESFPKRSEPTALFLNGIHALHNAGMPMRYSSFRRAFSRAALLASSDGSAKGLMESRLCEDPDSGEKYVRQICTAHPHMLRHTFAVWTYCAEKKQGNNEPWKVISSLLGHKHLQTTTDIYLRAVGEFEKFVSDRQCASIKEILES